MNTPPQPSSLPFLPFIFRKHRPTVLVVSVILALEFILFKVLYPHAILTPDSSYYIDAAERDLSINYWPIGYSIILRGFHVLMASDWLVVILQYLFLEGAALFFYFTVLYFLHPGKWVARAILLLVTINPILLIISNYILSDSIFTALTVLWFTLMLWLLYRPSALQVYLVIVLLFLLYTIRYYAVFYPVFTLIVMLFSRISWRVKIAGLALGCALFAGFFYYTAGQYGKLLGRREFSPFSGWRLAENALIMYTNVQDHTMDAPPVPLQPLHRFVTHHLDSTQKLGAGGNGPNVFLSMTDRSNPLVRYMLWQYRNDSLTDYFTKWASMGHLYNQYANFLIRRHPLDFVRYYMGPGVQWYLVPAVEIPNEFENGEYWVSDQMKEWFGYPSNSLTCTSSKIFSTMPYLIVMALLNVIMVLSSIAFFGFGLYKKADAAVKKALLLAISYWLVNFLFNVVASPAMLRYGLPMMIFNAAFGLILLEKVLRADQPSPSRP